MRLSALLILFACVPGRAQRPVNPRALEGVTLGLPPPADLRQTPGIGCGQISQDLAQRAHKALIVAFSDAGAAASNSDRAPWTLTIALRQAGMALENAARRARPPGEGRAAPAARRGRSRSTCRSRCRGTRRAGTRCSERRPAARRRAAPFPWD